ncbi:hypothetical protein PAT01_39450 [Pseudoalteromonas atlantica]|uniref:Uncharacterized protein n=1 Tax=Pseudoalteromonas atlantica TaxID=288 RepID=A0ABQ0UJK0_PSEAF|nr:hypothetical protein [Pseudoalteromonas sp. NSLLW218]MBH0087931.1 hypothetical protein [Pseudoalteromonas sp. NSLLW218]GEK78641.1 hypothetical protein PAT01_39450 [Pseudoalteromonas atlantica]
MIDFNVISEIVESTLKSGIEELCHSIFKEKPEFHHDDDLDETYLIMKDSGVSILYNEDEIFECLFFHFEGDSDTKACQLEVVYLNQFFSPYKVKETLLGANYNYIKEIMMSSGKYLKVKSALVFEKDKIYFNAEFNEDNGLSLLSVMSEKSFPG